MGQDVSRAQAVAMLWHKGILTWKLKPVQKDLYESLANVGRYKTIVWSCSRRLGKSYCLSVLAIEQCLKNPNTIVKFLAPTQKHIKTILRPIFRDILKDCPEELLPHFRTADNVFHFTHNNSEVQLAGTDAGHAEGLRGGNSHLCLIDEAGFCDNLSYIIKSILIPTTTTTKGKIILSSTPPVSADHDFARYMEESEERGTFIKKTIYDCVGSTITIEDLDDIISEVGGVDSPDFRREYMCQLIKGDDSSFVVPEFNEELAAKVVKEWKRPPHFDSYVGGDIGFKDFTVMLFGYYDFTSAKVIIEDELVLNGPKMTTDLLAKEIKRKEAELYTNKQSGDIKKPYLRVCDNNLIVINDLQQLHGLTFLATGKDDKDAVLNQLRILLKQERIIIHPRCKTLILHLKNGRWNKTRTTFLRDPRYGHYDAIDSIAYLIRNIQFGKNPYPANYGKGSGDNWFHVPNAEKEAPTPAAKAIQQIFKIKRRSLF